VETEERSYIPKQQSCALHAEISQNDSSGGCEHISILLLMCLNQHSVRWLSG